MERRFTANAVPAFQAMLAVERTLEAVDKQLKELIKVRVSQLNGCAYCLDMHLGAARASGVAADKLDLVAAWREADVFDARERAALAWAEAITFVSETHVPDDVYAEVARHFAERELTELTWAIAAINLWNRVLVAARTPPAHKR